MYIVYSIIITVIKVKNLLEENQEIRKQKESNASLADGVQRSQAKEIAQLQGNLKSIEVCDKVKHSLLACCIYTVILYIGS